MTKKINFIEKKTNLDQRRPDLSLFTDLFFFIFLIFIQEILLTSFIQLYKLDILTPFLSYYIITRSRLRTFFIIVVSTLNLELVTTVPKGFYICFWLIAAQIIFHFRTLVQGGHSDRTALDYWMEKKTPIKMET